jgi:acyl-CoA hydrolase
MLFGGKVLAEMDRCAGITTRRFLYSSPTGARDAVTKSMAVTFQRSAQVKDLVIVTGKVTKVGDTSVTLHMTAERETATGRELLVEGDFVFVAYDLEKKTSVAHGIKLQVSP